MECMVTTKDNYKNPRRYNSENLLLKRRREFGKPEPRSGKLNITKLSSGFEPIEQEDESCEQEEWDI